MSLIASQTTTHYNADLYLQNQSKTSLIRLVQLAWQVQKERKMLSGLDMDQLNDIGVTHSQAYQESEKHIFDIPKSRMS